MVTEKNRQNNDKVQRMPAEEKMCIRDSLYCYLRGDTNEYFLIIISNLSKAESYQSKTTRRKRHNRIWYDTLSGKCIKAIINRGNWFFDWRR